MRPENSKRKRSIKRKQKWEHKRMDCIRRYLMWTKDAFYVKVPMCPCVHMCACIFRTWPSFLSGASWLTGSCITISNTIMYTVHFGTLLWVCACFCMRVSVSVRTHFNSILLKQACHCSTQSISLAVINCHNQISFLKNTCGRNQTNKARKKKGKTGLVRKSVKNTRGCSSLF